MEDGRFFGHTYNPTFQGFRGFIWYGAGSSMSWYNDGPGYGSNNVECRTTTTDWIIDHPYHIAGTWTQNIARIYVNGVLEHECNIEPFLTGTDQLTFGAASSGIQIYVNCRIDEVRMWSEARTEQQIHAAMDSPLIGNEPGLEVYYRLDDCGGTLIADETVHGRDGTVIGAPACVDACGPTDQPIYNPANGHYYLLVAAPTLWPVAKAAAEAMVFEGTCGHLATITSGAENDFVVEVVMNDVVSSAYIGGYQPDGSPEPGGGWRWLTVEPFDYTNWGWGQPDQNGGENENVIEVKGLTSAFPYAWHDQAGDTDLFPYIVEFSPELPFWCASDVTGPILGEPDGNVDVLDYLLLLSQWGTPCIGSCEADITGPTPGLPDGNVDSLDFLLLISQWGSPGNCPSP